MTKTLLPLLSLAAVVALPSAAQAADGVYGDWITQGGSAVVRIAECTDPSMAGTPCGVILSADIPDGAPTKDVNNEDPTMRDKPIVGLTMLDEFEWSGGKWKKGRIYNPEDGKSYKSSIAVDEDNANVLKVKGCIAFLCQTQEWARVTP